MIYVSKLDTAELGRLRAYITDSASGETFTVIRKGKKWYRDGKRFKIKDCLGYFDSGFVWSVDRRMLELMKYIKGVEFIRDRPDAIRVSSMNVSDIDRHRILYLFDMDAVQSLLDIILRASGSENFLWMLQSGKLVVRLGDKCLAIIFCGKYYAYIIKLLTLLK